MDDDVYGKIFVTLIKKYGCGIIPKFLLPFYENWKNKSEEDKKEEMRGILKYCICIEKNRKSGLLEKVI